MTVALSNERLYAVKSAAVKAALGRFRVSDLFREHAVGAAKPGAMNFVKNVGRHGAEFLREGIFGSPISVASDLRKAYGQTKSVPGAYGRYMKNFYLSPDAPKWVKGLSVGLPVMDTAMQLSADDGSNRAGILASGAAGLATAPVFTRMGLAGLPLQAAVQEGARRAGSLLDKR